jgi:hypothetical protein
MKNGKAKVLDLKITADGDMRVTTAGREDRDVHIAIMRALSAPGTRFELVGDTAVLCKPPIRKRT